MDKKGGFLEVKAFLGVVEAADSGYLYVW